MLQLNIRSLLGKQNELNLMLNELHKRKSLPKILLLSETHLNNSKQRHPNMPYYNIICHNRANKQGGGVAILIHRTLTFKEHKDLDYLYEENFECKFIELK